MQTSTCRECQAIHHQLWNQEIGGRCFRHGVITMRVRPIPVVFPTVVCLCGSTRFYEAFQQANLAETLAGRIVLSIGCDTNSDDGLALGPEVKQMLDDLHKRKIDLADEILVLNVGGYIGSSTRSELEYARECGKRIRWLEEASHAQ